jgi:hypothetical protein
VWDGEPGVLKASRTLNADQFFVHAFLSRLAPGTEYHYRFRYAAGREAGATPDAAFSTAPDRNAAEHQPGFDLWSTPQEGLDGPFVVLVFIELSFVVEVVVLPEQQVIELGHLLRRRPGLLAHLAAFFCEP